MRGLIVGLALLCVTLGSTSNADAATTVLDNFSSYPLYGYMNPPASGQYAANWLSDGAAGGGPWVVWIDPTYAPTFGQYALTNGDPSGLPNDRWLSFTLHESQPIQSATLQLDYLVQTSASLGISVSAVDPYTSLVSVPFSFTKRANQGQIEDNTGLIDLTPYLAVGSSTLVVRFDAETVGSSYSHIRLDNFSLNVVTASDPSTIPEPSTLIIWSLLGVCGMGVGWWRRKRAA